MEARVLLAETARCLAAWLAADWPLPEPCLSLEGGLFCEYDFLVILFSLLICSSGTVFKRPDFRLPPSMMVVGPSASNFFHGGDSTILRVLDPGGGGVESRSLRRFAGLSSSGVSVARACPLVSPFSSLPSEWPLALGAEVRDWKKSSDGDSGGVDSADRGESGDDSAASLVGAGRESVMMGGGRRGDFEVGGSLSCDGDDGDDDDGRRVSRSAALLSTLESG